MEGSNSFLTSPRTAPARLSIPLWDIDDVAPRLADVAGREDKRGERALVGSLLREARLKAGVRQVDLAVSLGVHQSFVSKYESGERRLDVLEVRRICHHLGITLGDLDSQLAERIATA